MGCVENGGEGHKRQDLEGGREGEEQLGTLSTNELESVGKRQGKRCEGHFGACESFLPPRMREKKGMYLTLNTVLSRETHTDINEYDIFSSRVPEFNLQAMTVSRRESHRGYIAAAALEPVFHSTAYQQ